MLDFGCNKGSLVKFLSNRSNNVSGYYINKEAINNSNIKRLSITSIKETNYQDNTFDKFISSHVIEHIDDLKNTMREIKRILKPDGICVFIYPFELIRGSNNFIESIFVYKSFFYSRKLHLHKRNSKKLETFTDTTLIRKGVFWGPYPIYFTIFKKNNFNLCQNYLRLKQSEETLKMK